MRAVRWRAQMAVTVALLSVAVLHDGQAQTAIPFDHAGLARQALDKHIRPGYATLVEATQTLTRELDTYCKRTTADHRRAVDRAFDGLVTAWGRIEHIRFGPVVMENRLERILFWPDRRGLGARQVASTVRARDPDALDPIKLAGKRVAIQGIGALEIALFDETEAFAKQPENRAYRCGYAKAIATNIGNLAATILKEWSDPDGYARHWISAGEGNPLFLKSSETTLALAKSLDNGLERIRDDRIAGPLGFGPQRRQLPAVLGKSGRTLRLIQADLEGLHHLYMAAGLHKAIVDAGRDHPTVTTALNAKLVEKEILTARDEVRRLARRKGGRLDLATMTQPLIAIGFPLKNARQQVAALLALTANLSIGFNASDGD